MIFVAFVLAGLLLYNPVKQYPPKYMSSVTTSSTTSEDFLPKLPNLTLFERLGISEVFQKQLLSTRESEVVDDKFGAYRMQMKSPSNSVVWLLVSHPGLLDRPKVALGIQNGELHPFFNWDQITTFFNKEFETASSFLTTKKTVTDFAVDLLKIHYFSHEFGYANNTDSIRGYQIVSSASNIVGATSVKFPISSPRTVKKGENFSTEIWFWGKHNCKLHKFTLIMNAMHIETVYDVVIAENVGKCSRLFYE